jgi:hypothetical protein
VTVLRVSLQRRKELRLAAGAADDHAAAEAAAAAILGPAPDPNVHLLTTVDHEHDKAPAPAGALSCVSAGQRLVSAGGLEPPRAEAHMALNHPSTLPPGASSYLFIPLDQRKYGHFRVIVDSGHAPSLPVR